MVLSLPTFIPFNPYAVIAAIPTNRNNVDASSYHTTLPVSEETLSFLSISPSSSTPTSQAALQIPRSFQSTDIVNSNGIYEITFITATTGNIKTIEIVFPTGTGIGPAGYIERVGIGPGFFSKAGTTLTYNVQTAETISAGTFIRFELVNVKNPSNPSSILQATITTKDTNGNVIDGPTPTAVYAVRQIGTSDIAPGSVFPTTIERLGVAVSVNPGATIGAGRACLDTEEIVGGGYILVGDGGRKHLKVVAEEQDNNAWVLSVTNTDTQIAHSFQPIAECLTILP